jgi:glutamyl-tRNA reductase
VKPSARYDLHVFGLNLGTAPEVARREMRLTQGEVRRILTSLASAHTAIEAVVVRARNHVEAFVAAPAGSDAVRPWISHLRQHRPDLLHPERRALHYHLSGPAAEKHLAHVASGRFVRGRSSSTATRGLKAALAVAAHCGSLGRNLDGMFVRALAPVAVDPAGASIKSRY